MRHTHKTTTQRKPHHTRNSVKTSWLKLAFIPNHHFHDAQLFKRRNQGKPDGNRYMSHWQTAKWGSYSDPRTASSSFPLWYPNQYYGKQAAQLCQTCLTQDADSLCHTQRESPCHDRFKYCLYLREDLTVNVLNYIMLSSHSDVWLAPIRIIQQQSIPCCSKRMLL